jgi:hypothetical protein
MKYPFHPEFTLLEYSNTIPSLILDGNVGIVTVSIIKTDRTNSRFILFFIENTPFIIKYDKIRGIESKIN